MKYIYALLISLFLPTVVFAQSVPVSWLRNTASGFLTPLNINDSVGIGSTTPISQLTVQKTIVSDVDYPALALSRNDTTNALGDSLGDIDFWSNDASTDGPGIGSRIRGVVDDVAGRSYGLSLWTRSGGAGTPISEKMRIASDGKVGIGTTTPRSRLQISEAGSAILTLHRVDGSINPADEYGSIDWYTNEAQLTGGASVATYIKGVAPADVPAYNTTNPYGELQFGVSNNTAVATAMTLSRAGNLGIGTTTPWTRLAVTGSTTIAGGPLIVLGTSNTPISADTDWYRQFGLFRKDINDYSFMTLENRNGGSNASVDFLFNNDRTTALSYYWDLGFNSSAFNNPAFGLLNVPNAAYEYVTDGPKISATATTSSAGYFDFITGGLSSSRLRITSTGNIGIGTTTPQEKLSVLGDISLLYGSSIKVRAHNDAAWTSGTTALIKTDFSGSQDTVSIFTPGSQRSTEVLTLKSSGNVGIGTTSPQSTLSVGSVNDATNSYAQIDSVNGAPTAGDCDTDLERGRMIIDYSNNRFYICNGATRGWDYSALTD